MRGATRSAQRTHDALHRGDRRSLDHQRAQLDQAVQRRAVGGLIEIGPAEIRPGEPRRGLGRGRVDRQPGGDEDLAVGEAELRPGPCRVRGSPSAARRPRAARAGRARPEASARSRRRDRPGRAGARPRRSPGRAPRRARRAVRDTPRRSRASCAAPTRNSAACTGSARPARTCSIATRASSRAMDRLWVGPVAMQPITERITSAALSALRSGAAVTARTDTRWRYNRRSRERLEPR